MRSATSRIRFVVVTSRGCPPPDSFASACIPVTPRGPRPVRARRWARRPHDGRIAHQRPGDRDTLSHAHPRVSLARLSTCAAEADRSSIERARRRSSPRGKRPVGPEPSSTFSVAVSAAEQVVLLEDEPMRAHTLERACVGTFQSWPSTLRCPDCAARMRRSASQRCLARARRSRDDDDLADGIVADTSNRIWRASAPCRSGGRAARRRRVPPRSSETSAGSSLPHLAQCQEPDSAQTASMMRIRAASCVYRHVQGGRVAPAATRKGEPTPRRPDGSPAPRVSQPCCRHDAGHEPLR